MFKGVLKTFLNTYKTQLDLHDAQEHFLDFCYEVYMNEDMSQKRTLYLLSLFVYGRYLLNRFHQSQRGERKGNLESH